MIKIRLKDGLLFTSMEVFFRGNSKVIENIVIDTGAAETIISPDAVDEIGIFTEFNDSIYMVALTRMNDVNDCLLSKAWTN